MPRFNFREKSYRVDKHGFLLNSDDWDEEFAEGMAPNVRIAGGLTAEHWKVIRFIRNSFDKMNECPQVYIACRNNELGLGDLKRLFPSGYLRGACKLAGVTYAEAQFQRYWLEENLKLHQHDYERKTYQTDVHGFLVDPADWDEYYAIAKAHELKMLDHLTKEHWRIIYYLREQFQKRGEVPTVYDACEDNRISLDELERLFPDGYHRGALKIAGLRVRDVEIE